MITMSLDAVKILEISITKNTRNEILECIQKSLTIGAKNFISNKKNASFTNKIFTIVTPNPEQIVYAREDRHFKELLNQADISIPDGVGVVWASKLLSSSRFTNRGLRVPAVIPGVDFMDDLVSLAIKQRVGVALIGGRDGLALSAFECLHTKYPDIKGIAIDAPEFHISASGLSLLNFESGITNYGKESGNKSHDSLFTIHYSNIDEYFEMLAQRIIKSGIRVVFVGLGAPKQEYFIEKLSYSLLTLHSSLPIILMSVGGSFDEIAGRIPVAPKWVSRIGLKWLWRLILEPWRIRRQLALVKFVWLVLLERYIPK
jgi:N-acetylglucosaminyldiphosphoundecaprenol N-acetyl-beta-D-mannosaminyltransferase